MGGGGHRLYVLSFCARAGAISSLHTGHVTRTAWTTSLLPLYEGADVWVAGGVDAAAFVKTEVDHHAPPAAAGPAWATSAPQISAHTACKRTVLTGGHYPIAAPSVAQRGARTQRGAVTVSKRGVLKRGQ